MTVSLTDTLFEHIPCILELVAGLVHVVVKVRLVLEDVRLLAVHGVKFVRGVAEQL